MNFESFSDFVAMGGHGRYVWSAYAIALAILVFNAWQPIRQRKRLLLDQARRLRREEQHASSS